MGKTISSDRINRKYLFVAVGVVILMLYGRDMFEMNISPLIFAVVSIALALPMGYNEYMCYLFFLFPLGSGLPGSYMMPILAVLWIIKKKQLPSYKTLLFFIVVALIELFHFINYTFGHNILMIVRYLSCFFLFTVAISDYSHHQQHNQRAAFFVAGTLTAVLCIIIRTYIMGAIDAFDIVRVGEIEKIDETLEGRIMLSMNPNAMAFIAVTSMAICIYLFLKNVYSNNVILLVSLAVLLISICLSISRSGIIAALLSALLFLFSNGGSKRTRFFFIMGLVVLAVVFLIYSMGWVDAVVGRFSDDTVGTAGDRAGVFARYNEFLINNPFYLWLGTGAVYYREAANMDISVHNSIQQILVSYGIVGLSLFSFAAMSLAKQFKGVGFMAWVPVIVVLFNMQAIQFLMPFSLLYPIVAAFEIVKGASVRNVIIPHY